MFVKFKTNLGANDARHANLRFDKCIKGTELECSDENGKWLVANGIAEAIVAPAPIAAVAKPVELKAVQPEPLAAKAFDKSPSKQGK
tara:strand:+ start:526 stop:786 length:261 start_codon:yes stop_codon:yes gene_type:complete